MFVITRNERPHYKRNAPHLGQAAQPLDGRACCRLWFFLGVSAGVVGSNERAAQARAAGQRRRRSLQPPQAVPAAFVGCHMRFR